MPTIASPLPRPASFHRDSSPMQLMSSLPYPFQMDTPASRRVMSIPTLMSPINLAESCPGSSLFKPQSPPPCCPTLRRRGSNVRTSRRRRHCARADCRFDISGAGMAFDHLPWISAMESTPEQLNTWDMADLSQLPADDFCDDFDASGPGPIRRRKTSLRTNPLASDHESTDSSLLRLRMQPFDGFPMLSDPRTPTSEIFDPSAVQFYDLLPVFPPRNSHSDE